MRALQVFIDATGLKPDKMLELEVNEAKSRLVDVARSIRDRGSPSWALAIIKSIRSFCRYNGKEIKLLRGETIRPRRKRIEVEIIPNKEQLYRLVDSASSLRDKAIILCLWQSGVRVNCLVKWDYGLIKGQMNLESEKEPRIPIRVKVTENLDTKLRGYDVPYYYTFLGREAALALRDYLVWRRNNGERFRDETSVFISHSTTVSNRRLREASIRELVKRTAKIAGLNPEGIWTHCLRKAFRKVLNNSDLDEDTREAVMGHKLPGSRGSYFDAHDVDEIEKKYLKCNFSRSEPLPENLKEEMVLSLIREQVKIFGIDPVRVRIEKMKELGREPTIDEEKDVLQLEIKKLGITPIKLKEDESRFKNKLVKERELERYLDDGWEVMQTVNSKILVRKRTQS